MVKGVIASSSPRQPSSLRLFRSRHLPPCQCMSHTLAGLQKTPLHSKPPISTAAMAHNSHMPQAATTSAAQCCARLRLYSAVQAGPAWRPTLSAIRGKPAMMGVTRIASRTAPSAYCISASAASVMAVPCLATTSACACLAREAGHGSSSQAPRTQGPRQGVREGGGVCDEGKGSQGHAFQAGAQVGLLRPVVRSSNHRAGCGGKEQRQQREASSERGLHEACSCIAASHAALAISPATTRHTHANSPPAPAPGAGAPLPLGGRAGAERCAQAWWSWCRAPQTATSARCRQAGPCRSSG
jgi:hypothetical protein